MNERVKDLTKEVDREKAGREEAVKTAKEKKKNYRVSREEGRCCREIPGINREKIGRAGDAAK